MRMRGAGCARLRPRERHGYDPCRQRRLVERQVPGLRGRSRRRSDAADQGPDGWDRQPSAAARRCGRWDGAGRPRLFDRSCPGRSAALATAGAWLRDELKIHPVAVGHRVVHGGPDYDRPVRIDHNVLARLERYVSLAPLHQPYNLAPIRSLLAQISRICRRSPASIPPSIAGTGRLADHYAIPRPASRRRRSALRLSRSVL